MDEQIRSILAQETTKTRKIQLLLLLGLTRRQVADLVTRGNCGWVYNVYKKMVSSGTFIPSQTTAVPTSVLNYSFNHRFGVEIEAYNCSRERLARELRDAGIQVSVEGYNHDARNRWKLVTDSSLEGRDTFELVSPILVGEEGLKELETVCWVLDACDVKVNESCGFHVHMDASDFSIETWKNLALSYKHIETLIDSFMPRSRRDNRYCKSLNALPEARIIRAATIHELQQVFGNNRYYKVNLEAYSRHRTVEFRQHSGTINFAKMEKWIRFINGLIIFARTGQLPNRTTLDRLPFLDEKQKLFFKLRTKKLAVAV